MGSTPPSRRELCLAAPHQYFECLGELGTSLPSHQADRIETALCSVLCMQSFQTNP